MGGWGQGDRGGWVRSLGSRGGGVKGVRMG